MLLHRNKIGKMNKRGLSEVVAYVMLISMALALSGIIYAWLKTTATTQPNEKCDENIALILKDYNCSYEGDKINLNLRLKNQGLFSVEGYLIRVSTDEGSKIADITLDKTGSKIGPTEEISVSYNITVENEKQVTLIDLQPFQFKDSVKILCDLQSQEITNCGA